MRSHIFSCDKSVDLSLTGTNGQEMITPCSPYSIHWTIIIMAILTSLAEEYIFEKKRSIQSIKPIVLFWIGCIATDGDIFKRSSIQTRYFMFLSLNFHYFCCRTLSLFPISWNTIYFSAFLCYTMYARLVIRNRNRFSNNIFCKL